MQFAFGAKDFLHHLLIYHYIFFIVLFVLSVLLLILGVILRKRPFFASIFYLSSFLSLFFAPFAGSYYLEEYLRGSSLDNIKITRLVYTKAIIVNATLSNHGTATVKETKLLFTLVKKDNNSILEMLNAINPALTQRVYLNDVLKPHENKDIRVVVDVSKLHIPSAYTIYYQLKSF